MSAEIICSCKNISFYHGGKMSAVTVVVSDWPTYSDWSYSGECRDYLVV